EPLCALEQGPDGIEHPIDRLVHVLGLTPCEVDLILLAAMADEHEGYASVLRTLNPRGEPSATVGLAAQLVCRSTRERLALREVLEEGAAVASGVVALAGDGPFFERNLTLADGLWSALCGGRTLPATLEPIRLGGAAHGLERWIGSAEVASARRAL